MAQSKEYPDLKWMPPRAWESGRDGKAVRFIVIHYTAGSERATSAEDGARYNQARRDGTSAHYFVDRDSVVHCVLTKDTAFCARERGNDLGIQYELCGTAQTRKQWLDAASLATLKNAAKQVARDCRKYDIPPVRLSVAQTRAAWTRFPNGPKGIVGHVDCTYAYPEDNGDHTDPGKDFPWDIFLGFVRAELNPEPDPAPKPNPVEESMDLDTDLWNRAIPPAWAAPFVPLLEGGHPTVRNVLVRTMQDAAAASNAVDQLLVSQEAILAGVNAILTDPSTMTEPETHPVVRAVRWAMDHPPTGMDS
jgi:N-acetyl-anhydromuramyl-L-alanine amidase AmpD